MSGCACMAAGYRARLLGPNNPNYRRALSKSQFCRRCGVEILSYQTNRLYCSRQCYEGDSRTMTRRACRKDKNHGEIVTAFKKLQCRVIDLSTQGKGVPDLLVGVHETWHMVEVKNPKQAYGRRGLSQRQQRFDDATGGTVSVVRTLDDVLALVTKWRGEASPAAMGQPAVVARVRTAKDAIRAIGVTP
jgi:hypothetical protein